MSQKPKTKFKNLAKNLSIKRKMEEEPVSTSTNKETSAYAIEKKIRESIKPKNQNKSNQMR